MCTLQARCLYTNKETKERTNEGKNGQKQTTNKKRSAHFIYTYTYIVYVYSLFTSLVIRDVQDGRLNRGCSEPKHWVPVVVGRLAIVHDVFPLVQRAAIDDKPARKPSTATKTKPNVLTDLCHRTDVEVWQIHTTC